MALLHWIKTALPGLSLEESESTICRNPLDSVASSPESTPQCPASKDVVIDELSGLTARIFLPHICDDVDKGEDGETKKKVPLFLYFHGGGFLVFDSRFPFFHHFCESLARFLKAVVVSVDYRLSPEHRLPAAYEDAIKSLEWLETRARAQEDWIATRADFSRVFLAGDSAGANIALQSAMLWNKQLNPPAKPSSSINLAGIVLIQPFYGGIERTESEREFGDGVILTMESTDLCWKMALPIGADRDHPYCNPGDSKFLDGCLESVDLPPIYIVAGCEDGLFDRQAEAAKILEKANKKVQFLAIEKASHAFYLGPPSDPAADQFFRDLAVFVTNVV